MIALQLIGHLVIRADDGLRTVPCALAGRLAWLQDGCQGSVRLLAPARGLRPQDGRPHQGMPELQARLVTGEKPCSRRGVQGIDGHLDPGQFRCRCQYLRQRGLAVGSGDEQGIARLRTELAQPPGEGLLKSRAQRYG